MKSLVNALLVMFLAVLCWGITIICAFLVAYAVNLVSIALGA